MNEHPFVTRLRQDWIEHPNSSHYYGLVDWVRGVYVTRHGSCWLLDPTGRCIISAPPEWSLTSAEARQVANADSLYIALCDEPVFPGHSGDSPVVLHYYSHIGLLNMVDSLDDALHESDKRSSTYAIRTAREMGSA